jgi:hypothetical protein
MSRDITGFLDFYGIWGSSGSDVFAVGEYGTILHYDGTSWSSMVSGTTNHLTGVWGSSGNDVFAMGEYGVILHYDGSSWSFMEIDTTYNLNGVWGSSGSDVFAVGYAGTIFHYDGPSSMICPSESIYGEHSKQTELLRCFRDNVLNQTPEGQEIIRLYYEWSPAIVKAIEQDEEFKEEVKGMIDGVLGLSGGVE